LGVDPPKREGGGTPPSFLFWPRETGQGADEKSRVKKRVVGFLNRGGTTGYGEFFVPETPPKTPKEKREKRGRTLGLWGGGNKKPVLVFFELQNNFLHFQNKLVGKKRPPPPQLCRGGNGFFFGWGWGGG